MDRLCGNGSSPSMASRRIGCGVARLLAVVTVLGVAGAPAAGAADRSRKEPPRPQKLWNAYPLESAGTPSPQPPASSGRFRPRSAASRGTSDSGDRKSSLLLWVAVGAFGAAVVAFAVSWRGAAPVWRARRRVSSAGERLRAFNADPATRTQGPRETSGEGLALAAHRPHVAWPEVRRLHVPGGRFARKLSQVLHKGADTRAQPRDFSADAVSSAQPRDAEDRDAARERAVLKRKRAAATSEEVRKLRDKKRAVTQERDQREIGALKAKLADPPTKSPIAPGVAGGHEFERRSTLPARPAQKGER
jgi:hypothetical protein